MPVPITRDNLVDPANPSVSRCLERLAEFRGRRLRLSAEPTGSEFQSFAQGAKNAAESAFFSGVRSTQPAVRSASKDDRECIRVERVYLTTDATMRCLCCWRLSRSPTGRCPR